MKQKLFWTIAIVFPTIIVGFVGGLFFIPKTGEHQSADYIGRAPSKAGNPAAKTSSTEITSPPWNVYFNGIGPIRIGMSPREAEAAITAPLVGNENHTAACYYIHPKEGPRKVRLMVISDRIARIDVDTSEIATISGARIGHTEEQIRVMYPGQIRVERHNYDEQGHYLTLVPNDPRYSQYRIVFETDGKVVTRYRAGKIPEVEWIEGCS